ncbi:NYN domain-containing protein [Paraburkholderia youngii]|uniref:NYN domain-containing protein n=1 Tax=Paraburkholderia youngii TaxID=2782701 RepID=UPI003D20E9A7
MPIFSSFYSGPSEIRYLFIDGGYLRERLETLRRNWFSDTDKLEVDYATISSGFTKTFYYDCFPAKTEGETEEAFNLRKQDTEKHFNMLRSLSGWHVSEGLAKWRKRQGSSQKEVDILIAVDMLTHTYRRNMHRLAFIAGDQDFRPLLEAVVREGMYVDLWYDPRSISQDLKHEADQTRELDLFTVHGFFTPRFRARHPIPTRSFHPTSQPENGIQVARGSINGENVAGLYSGPNGSWCSVNETKVSGNAQFLQMKLPNGDIDFLKRVYAAYGEQCEWTELT